VTGPETTSFLRILSDRGSAEALRELFDECAAAGPARCPFAAGSAEQTRARFDVLMEQLGAEPMIVQGPAGTLTVTDSLVAETVRGVLYAAPMWPDLTQGRQRLAEGDAVRFLEAAPASNCVDADGPRDPARFAEMVRRAEERTPYFGAAWAAIVEPCVFWTAQDADRHAGPWDVPTSATILLISRVYDPATLHAGAMAAAETLANARLRTIDGWGPSYFEGGLSTCANEIMASYLVDLELPPPGAVCAADASPFGDVVPAGSDAPTPVAAAEHNPKSNRSPGEPCRVAGVYPHPLTAATPRGCPAPGRSSRERERGREQCRLGIWTVSLVGWNVRAVFISGTSLGDPLSLAATRGRQRRCAWPRRSARKGAGRDRWRSAPPPPTVHRIGRSTSLHRG
jgi:hypothetical protein